MGYLIHLSYLSIYIIFLNFDEKMKIFRMLHILFIQQVSEKHTKTIEPCQEMHYKMGTIFPNFTKLGQNVYAVLQIKVAEAPSPKVYQEK